MKQTSYLEVTTTKKESITLKEVYTELVELRTTIKLLDNSNRVTRRRFYLLVVLIVSLQLITIGLSFL